MKRSKKEKDNHENTKQRKHERKNLVNPVKRININKIIEDFTNKLIKGEKITVDEVLNKYPKHAKELKPLLEASQLLLQAGDEFNAQIDKEVAEFDEELWQKLEQNILAKSVKAVEKQKAHLIGENLTATAIDLTIPGILETPAGTIAVPIKRLIQTLKSIPNDHIKSLALQKRFEYIILLLYVKGYQCRIGEGIRGITRFIKSLFLISKMTELDKLVKVYYDFVPYKIGPFDPAIYQDLKVLEMAGIIKRHTYKYKRPVLEDQKIDEGFSFNDESTIFTLTDEGMKYAKALANWCNKKDRKILEDLRRIKTTYGSAPLKKLLKYIYENYPEYTKESEVLEKTLKN